MWPPVLVLHANLLRDAAARQRMVAGQVRRQQGSPEVESPLLAFHLAKFAFSTLKGGEFLSCLFEKAARDFCK